MAPISYEQLVDLAEGRLPAPEAAALRQQVVADPALSAELAELEDLIGLMRADDSVDAPEHVIARAVRLARKPVVPPAPGLLQRIIAILRDTGASPALAAGLRSGAAAERDLTYAAGDWDLDLQLAPRAGRWQVRGQLFGPELSGSVTLQGVNRAETAEINELGEFVLPLVEPGSYALRMQLGATEILIETLELES